MSEHSELLVRYKQLRLVTATLNSQLTRLLSKESYLEGAKMLGFLREGILVFDNDADMAVLVDFCFHEMRTNGLTVYDRCLAECPPPPGSDEWKVLVAQQQSYYSVFVVESIEQGVGLHLRDLVRDESLFILEINLSRSGLPGLLLATQIYTVDGLSMTSGAALPLGVFPLSRRAALARRFAGDGVNPRNLSPSLRSHWIANVIRASLEMGATERMRLQEPGTSSQTSPERSPPPSVFEPIQKPIVASVHVGRNDPCVCGSGKKFKRCCGPKR